MANGTPDKSLMFNELGKSGLKAHSGVLYEEFLPQLSGTRAVAKYKEMRDNSAIVGAMLFAVESLLRSVSWSVEPASESNTDLAAAQFLAENQNDMSHTWEDFIAEVLSMLPFGWSYFEQVYKLRKGPSDNPRERSKYNDGKIGWRKFGFRSQDTLYKWELQPDGGIAGMWQQPPPNQAAYTQSLIFLPISKFLLFRTTSHKGSPEGRSILRNSYKSYYFVTKMEEIEAIGIERDLAGMPVMWVPIDLLAATKTSEAQSTYNLLKDIVTRVKRDEQEGLLLPLVYDDNGNPLYKFELLSTGGRRSFDTGAIIQRYIQQIAMTILADFILLGHESVGSFALSSDRTELFAVALGAWLDSIQETINRHAVTNLFQLNPSFRLDQLPRFVHGDIEKPNLTELATYVRDLSAAGAPLFPDLVLENKLREMADLPQADPAQREQMLEEQQAARDAMAAAKQQQPPPNGQPDNQPTDQPTNDAVQKALNDYLDSILHSQ